MATLLNTLIASIFSLLFAPEKDTSQAKISETTVEVTADREETTNENSHVCYYPQT